PVEAGFDCRMHKHGQVYGSQMLVIEDFDDARKPSWDDMAARIRERGEHYGMMRRDGFAASYPGRHVAIGQARVRAYGLPGMRQTRWIVGTHHLTTEEVRAATKFPDAIARCSWPL